MCTDDDDDDNVGNGDDNGDDNELVDTILVSSSSMCSVYWVLWGERCFSLFAPLVTHYRHDRDGLWNWLLLWHCLQRHHVSHGTHYWIAFARTNIWLPPWFFFYNSERIRAGRTAAAITVYNIFTRISMLWQMKQQWVTTTASGSCIYLLMG